MDNAKRIYALDFLKAIAALMITNSHFLPLYKDVSKSLATFGVHGNALFFFVSGYLLMMGFDKRKLDFSNWYKKRISRLWPSVFLWVLISNVVLGMPLTFERLILMDGYWFLQAIVINYALFYLVCNIGYKRFGGGKTYLGLVMIMSLLITIIYAVLMPRCEGSIFHTDLHYVCHFSVMIMGAIVYINKLGKRKNVVMQLFYALIFFLTYFLLMKIGKDKGDMLYYVQVLALIPLHAFVYFIYVVASCDVVKNLFMRKYIGKILHVVSSLTLEIYVVQFSIITDVFNSVFPLSIIIVFTLICIAAYFLHLITNFFLQSLSVEEYEWRKMVKI